MRGIVTCRNTRMLCRVARFAVGRNESTELYMGGREILRMEGQLYGHREFVPLNALVVRRDQVT